MKKLKDALRDADDIPCSPVSINAHRPKGVADDVAEK